MLSEYKLWKTDEIKICLEEEEAEVVLHQA